MNRRVCAYARIYAFLYAHTRILICMYTYTYTHICVYLYAHTCTLIRTYAYIYTRIMHIFWLTYLWVVLYFMAWIPGLILYSGERRKTVLAQKLNYPSQGLTHTNKIDQDYFHASTVDYPGIITAINEMVVNKTYFQMQLRALYSVTAILW